jgi:hypothetical protein
MAGSAPGRSRLRQGSGGSTPLAPGRHPGAAPHPASPRRRGPFRRRNCVRPRLATPVPIRNCVRRRPAMPVPARNCVRGRPAAARVPVPPPRPAGADKGGSPGSTAPAPPISPCPPRNPPCRLPKPARPAPETRRPAIPAPGPGAERRARRAGGTISRRAPPEPASRRRLFRQLHNLASVVTTELQNSYRDKNFRLTGRGNRLSLSVRRRGQNFLTRAGIHGGLLWLPGP